MSCFPSECHCCHARSCGEMFSAGEDVWTGCPVFRANVLVAMLEVPARCVLPLKMFGRDVLFSERMSLLPCSKLRRDVFCRRRCLDRMSCFPSECPCGHARSSGEMCSAVENVWTRCPVFRANVIVAMLEVAARCFLPAKMFGQDVLFSERMSLWPCSKFRRDVFCR